MITDYDIPQLMQYDLEFSWTYALLDYRDKVVINVGSDFGSSPYWFLRRGAKKVICYEADDNYRRMSQYFFENDNRVEIFGRWPVKDAVKYMPGHVFTCDIEGGEVNVDEELFTTYSEWAIAVHPEFMTSEAYARIKDMLKVHNARLVYVTGDCKELMYLSPK